MVNGDPGQLAFLNVTALLGPVEAGGGEWAFRHQGEVALVVSQDLNDPDAVVALVHGTLFSVLKGDLDE